MATTAQRSAADNPRYPAAQDFLRDVKSVFVDRPAVYEEILKNLNKLWKKADTEGCVARVEALLATAPSRAALLARLRDFMAPHAVQAWQQSAPPSDPGKGEGSAREPISFESDDEAAAADAVDADDNSDDDVVLVSTTLTNPLVDLPHARHECAALGMPVRDDADGLLLARRFCARCYCTLCDRPVSDCAAWPEHSRYRDEPPWRAVRDALVAVPEPPPRRFKRPRLRAAAPADPRRAPRPQRPGAWDAAVRRYYALQAAAGAARRPPAPAAAPAPQARPVAPRARLLMDDAFLRTRELLATDGEIKRQFDNGSLTVDTLRTAVATSLGVDEEAIKYVVKATLAEYLLGPLPRLPPAPRAPLVTSTAPRERSCPNTAATRAAARNTRRRSFWAGGESAAPPPEQQDGNDSDVGAYFELSDDDN